MNTKIACLLPLVLCLTGCSLYMVRSTPGGDHQGIPFYVKTAGCQRQIVRLKPYDLLTLTIKTGEKTSHSETSAVCRENFTAPAFVALRNAPGTGNADDIAATWKAVKGLRCDPQDEPAAGSKDSFIASNTISAYPYVDYRTQYTLNVRRPIIGTAAATTKLASDGTLTEGTAQVEDKTVETVLSTITSALGAAPAAAAFVPAASTYELKIEEKGVKFTRIYRDPVPNGPCETDAQLTGDPPPATNTDFVVEDAGAKKAADDSNSVKVNGTIQLPKAKDAGGDTKK